MNIRNSYSCCIIKRNYQTNFSISINSFSTSYQKCARCSRKNRSFDGIYKEINDKNTPCYAITPIVISSTRHVVAKGLRNNMKKNYKKVYIYIYISPLKFSKSLAELSRIEKQRQGSLFRDRSKISPRTRFLFPPRRAPFLVPTTKKPPYQGGRHRIRARFRDHLMPKYHRHRQ